MSIAITVDGGVLVCPREGVTGELLRAFVARLLELSRLMDEDWIAVLTTKHSGEALASDDLFTWHEELEGLLRAHGVDEYSANDIMRVTDGLLYKPPWLEDCLGMGDAVLGCEVVTTRPDVLGLSAGPHLRRELERCLVLLALHGERCGPGEDQHVVALGRAPEDMVDVCGRVRCGGADPSLGVGSRRVQGSVRICDCLPGLIRGIDECALLRNAKSDKEVDLACRVAVYKARTVRGVAVDWDEVERWRVGGRFREAAQKCCRASADDFAPKLVRAVVKAIERESLEAVHALRTGRRGSPQRRRERDGAAAQRRDIDDNYHIQYWELKEGVVELSWVGPHNDFRIRE